MRDSTVSDLNELHTKARTARSRLEPTWYMNLAYYSGEQWLSWDGRQLYKPQLRRSRITVVDNRIQPCIRTEIARMTKQRPVFTVTPRTSDEEDANAAEMGEQLMKYLWKHLNLHELTIKGLHWSRICASGFFKVFWDPSIGDSIDVVVGPDGKTLRDADGGMIRANTPDHQQAMMVAEAVGQQVRTKQLAQGDIRVEVRSPFQMGVDPLADSFVEAEWVCEESVKSADYVKQRYNRDIEPDTPANAGLIEARMGQVLIPGAGSYKGVKVREYWHKPSSSHPNGRRAVWAPGAESRKGSGQMLFEDDKPFDACPYVMLAGIPVPGRLWPTCIAEQLRGPQTELNKVKSQIAENRNRVGNPTILASRQAIADPEKFIDATTMPGGVHFFDDVGSQNAVPSYLQAPPLPDYVVQEIERIEASIQEISGQHEVTSAQVPPGVTAASAINLLMEADDTRLGPAVADYEYQLGALGQKILKLAAHYYTDARTIRIAGDNGKVQIFDFRGSMLRDNTHVEVQAGSSFPQSKAAKQAAMQDMMTFLAQSGNALHGRQLSQFVEDWGFGNSLRFLSEYTVDETQANRENTLLAQGRPLPINEYDNDEIHIATHEDFQKSPRYGSISPQARMVCEQHVAAHRQRAAAQQQAQLEMQMRVSGTVDPTTSQAALQAEHELSQLKGTQDLQQQSQQGQLKAAQQQQQTALQGQQSAQQQGFTQADNEMRQRHADELHQQKLHHAEEAHRHQMSLAAEKARQQAQQAKVKEAPRGR